jgi:predicted naringenin-chalcone synthase
MELIHHLSLSATTERIHVGYMGCHGAINGLRVAKGLAASDPNACVLVCAVECCSLHYRFVWDDEGIVGNALFADGAAALVGTNEPTNGSGWTLSETGSCVLPDSRGAMSWSVGDHGFEMRLTNEVPEFISSGLRPWLTSWLEQAGLTMEEIGSFAIHPGGPRIVDAVQVALDLPREKTTTSRQVLDEFGNMSSPTILFILQRLRQSDAALPCLALAFGPGLVAEAALFC